MKSVFEENDLDDSWTTSVSTSLFHGADDVIVPYQNSVDAAANPGPKAVLVDCVEVPANHSTCVIPYINFVLSDFGGPY